MGNYDLYTVNHQKLVSLNLYVARLGIYLNKKSHSEKIKI